MKLVNRNDKDDKKALDILNKCFVFDDGKINLFNVDVEDRDFLINYIISLGKRHLLTFIDNLEDAGFFDADIDFRITELGEFRITENDNFRITE
jgi:hypothetical protein